MEASNLWDWDLHIVIDNQKIFNKAIERGDIVIFPYPENSKECDQWNSFILKYQYDNGDIDPMIIVKDLGKSAFDKEQHTNYKYDQNGFPIGNNRLRYLIQKILKNKFLDLFIFTISTIFYAPILIILKYLRIIKNSSFLD